MPALPCENITTLEDSVQIPDPPNELAISVSTTQINEAGPSTSTISTSTSPLPLPPPIKKKRRKRKKRLLEQQGKLKKGRKKITSMGNSLQECGVAEKFPKIDEYNIFPTSAKHPSKTSVNMLPVKAADVMQVRGPEFCQKSTSAMSNTAPLAVKDLVCNTASDSETLTQAKLLDEPSTSRLVVHDHGLLKKEKSQPSPQYSRFDFLANSIIITDVTTDRGTITIKECSAYEAFFGPEPNRPE